MYLKDGVEYVRKVGSRQAVWDEVCFCTAGKLTKDDLFQKGDRIVSKRRSELGKTRFKAANPFRKAAATSDDEKVEPVAEKPSLEPVAQPARRRARRKRRRRAV